ncbi:MAG: hypothetical protein ACOC35_07100 [Promethearchaeia archaeon]
MLSFIGWLDGLTAAGVILFGLIVGILSFYHARKLEAELLAVAGLTIFFVGLLWLGPFTDFLHCLILNRNLDNSFGLYGLLSYTWVAPALICAMYIGAELLIPDKKCPIFSIYIILGIFFELFLYLDTAKSFIFVEPSAPGEDLIDSSFIIGSPTFILIATFLISVLIFNGIGFFKKGRESIGAVRKKFYLLSGGFSLFSIAAAFDSLVAPGAALALVRIAVIISAYLMYKGLKT